MLHIIDTGGPGGAEVVLDTIVAHLAPDLWRSRVLIPEEDWLFRRLDARGADVALLPSGTSADVRYLARLVRAIRAFRPAVIHSHLLGSGVYASLAASLAQGVPLVCTFHGRPDVSLEDRLLPLKARILARRNNRIVYVSHDLRAYLEPRIGLPPQRGIVIHNGIEFREPRPEGNERDVCGAGPNDILVGAVGNIRPAKDYANLLKAAAIVCEARPNVRFAIVGDQRSPLTDPLKSLADELGLSPSVRFLGFREDVPALVTSWDLFVSSSRTEGLPLGIVEAVALGTPVVLTECGGVPEVVESGRTGSLVQPQDPGALARGILDALDNPTRTADMAKAGQHDVRARFSARRMCDSYQALYDQLIGEWTDDGGGP